MRNSGFTLMEMILALAITVFMGAIVYSSLNSVVNSIAMSRAAAEETRLRQFLAHSFETNFRSVYVDRLSEQPAFQFIGISEDSFDGPRDSVRFCSSAPLMGGMSLPGDLKEVRYEVISGEDTEMTLDFGDPGTEAAMEGPALEAVEMPLIAGNVEQLETGTGGFEEFAADPNYEAPHWSVPIRSMNIQYFDGTEWLDEWDSVQFGRVPWCVHIRINFAKTEEQLDAERAERYDSLDDPDFEMVIAIPAGMGITEDGRTLPDFSGESARQALEQLEAEAARGAFDGAQIPGGTP